jgi:hypothetical protein
MGVRMPAMRAHAGALDCTESFTPRTRARENAVRRDFYAPLSAPS